MRLGGMSIASAPDATTAPVAKLGRYPRSSISGTDIQTHDRDGGQAHAGQRAEHGGRTDRGDAQTTGQTTQPCVGEPEDRAPQAAHGEESRP